MRLLTLLLMLLALGVAGCGDDDSDDDTGGSSAVETQPQTQAETTPQRRNGCTEVAQPEPKPERGGPRPSEELTGDYEVTFETNCGSFTVAIDEQVGGLTAASFVRLAETGFYENTFFHRIVPGFVIQGGDPTGSGLGGPGYMTEDPPPQDARYPVGTVAMAKGQAEPPGSAGSQFFVAIGPGLTPDYAIVGEVTDGLDVVQRIGRFGDPADPAGAPTQIVTIEKTTVSGG